MDTRALPFLLILFAGSMAAQQSYTYVSVDIPNGSYPELTGINSNGIAVGYYSTPAPDGTYVQDGFVRLANGDILMLVPSFPSTLTSPQGISDSGVIVGYFAPTPTGQIEAFEVNQGTYHTFKYENFDTPLYGISTDNGMVGSLDELPETQPVYRAPDGTLDFLPSAKGFLTYPRGVNSSKEIVGINQNMTYIRYTEGFFLSPLGRFDIVRYPNAFTTNLYGINDSGVAVGDAELTSGAKVAFMYSGGQFTIFSFPGSKTTTLAGINNSGALVGSYTDASSISHAFVATPVN